jgi:hypothetical protein
MEAEGIPDWLKELSAAAPTEPEPDMPALPDNFADTPVAAAPLDEARNLTRLKDERQEQPPPLQEDSNTPDWLRGAPSEPPAEPSASAESLPSWLTNLTADETGAAAQSADIQPAPAWPEAAAEPSSVDESNALPSWLQGQESAGTSPTPADSNAGLWLDAGPPTGSAQTGAPTDAPGMDESSTPGWLQDTPSDEIPKEDEAEEPTIEPFFFGDPSDTPRHEPAAELPSWLAGISEGEGADAETDAGPSWLSGITDTPSTPASAGADAPDVPLWLQDVGTAPADESAPKMPAESQAEERGAEPPTQPPDNLPTWLREVEQAQPSASALPSWLQAEGAVVQPAEEPGGLEAESPAVPPAEDIPTWLRADVPPTPMPPPSAPEAPHSEELPPWLSAAVSSSAASAEQPPPPDARAAPYNEAAPSDDELPGWLRDAAPAPAENLPDWLRSSAPAEPPRAESAPPTAPERPADELPPWLRDESGQPLPTAGAPGDANLPEWLRGVDSASAPSDTAPLTPPNWLGTAPPTAPAPPGQVSLDWFGDDQGPSVADRAPAGESEFFGGAELPAWLRKAEAEPAAEISPADARSLDWLTKLGAHEEEGVAVAAPAMKLPLPAMSARTSSQVKALALLERLAAEPYPDAAPLPEPAAPTIWQRIGLERMLYVVLLAVLLVALTVPTLGAGLQVPPEAPGAADLFQQINALSDKDVVLVGYEWDARRISELKPLERAVIGQLIQKHVKLVLVSTDPQGTLLLFDLRDQLEAANYRKGGEDYILLGYKPGGELALRSLAQDFQGALSSDFQGNDATISALAGGLLTRKPLASLNDFSMLLVLADEPSDVQGWIEQIHRSVPQKALAFLLPAETAPIVQPYLQQPRGPQYAPIYHLAGKQGALAYEQLRGTGHTPAVQIARETGQQRLGILVFVALLVIGGIVIGVNSTMRQRATS